MKRLILLFALLSTMALLQTSPIPLHALDLGPAGLERGPIPPGGSPVLSPPAADFQGDGSPESLVLSAGSAALLAGEQVVWQSPEAWQVMQAAITDLDRDGQPEATLLVWRPFQPWPVDRWLPYGGRIRDFHDADGQSCHLILIGWRQGRYREVWAGSALADPIRSFAAADLNEDGSQELITLEASYADPRPEPGAPEGSTPARALKVWEWNGFGFSVVYSIEGSFTKMVPVHETDGHVLILIP